MANDIIRVSPKAKTTPPAPSVLPLTGLAAHRRESPRLEVTRTLSLGQQRPLHRLSNLSHPRFHRNQRHNPAVAVAVGSQPQQCNVAAGHQRFPMPPPFWRSSGYFDAGQPDLTPIRQLYGSARRATAPHLRSAERCGPAGPVLSAACAAATSRVTSPEADRHPIGAQFEGALPRTPRPTRHAMALQPQTDPDGPYCEALEWSSGLRRRTGTGCRRMVWNFRLRGPRPPA